MPAMDFDLVAERVPRAVALSKRGKTMMAIGMIATIIFLPTAFGIAGPNLDLAMPMSPMYSAKCGLQVELFEHSMEGPTRNTLPDNEASVQHTLGAGRSENMQDHLYYQCKYLYKQSAKQDE